MFTAVAENDLGKRMYFEAAEVFVVLFSSLCWREKDFLKFPLGSLEIQNPLVIKLVSSVLEKVLLDWRERGKGPRFTSSNVSLTKNRTVVTSFSCPILYTLDKACSSIVGFLNIFVLFIRTPKRCRGCRVRGK